MEDNYIRLDFSHEQKGIINTCTFNEYKHYFVSGFQAGTLAGMQEDFIKDVTKAINYALKADSTLHIMIDVSYNEKTTYRLIMDYNENGERALYLLTFDGCFSGYKDKYIVSKKEALNTFKAFYTSKMIEAAKAA